MKLAGDDDVGLNVLRSKADKLDTTVGWNPDEDFQVTQAVPVTLAL